VIERPITIGADHLHQFEIRSLSPGVPENLTNTSSRSTEGIPGKSITLSTLTTTCELLGHLLQGRLNPLSTTMGQVPGHLLALGRPNRRPSRCLKRAWPNRPEIG